MVRELVEAFGKPFPPDPRLKAFPKPEYLVQVPYEKFKEKLHLGYRTGYIYELAAKVADDPNYLQGLSEASLSSQEVRKRLLAIKGIGNYAAASFLMLIGRYDEIPVDSVFQQFMKKRYFEEQEFELGKALEVYESWGKWKYLAYWYELLDFYR